MKKNVFIQSWWQLNFLPLVSGEMDEIISG